MNRPEPEPRAASVGRTDHQLLVDHVAGDTDAFAELVRRHRDRLWAVALRTTGHREDAADALQDALIAAHRGAASFRGEAQVTTWLHRIVVNACLDRLRRNRVRAVEPLPEDDRPDPRVDRSATSVVGRGDPESAALAVDLRERLLGALETLPPEQKAVLVLVDMEGWPLEEVARILQVPTGTVKSRCARGRRRLGALLAAPGGPEDGTGRGHRASDHPQTGPDPAPTQRR